MDNLTHSLVGVVAARAGLDRLSPYATLICVAAANVPDIDTVTLFAGRYAYLEQHRGISHSILGTAILALALPLVFVVAERLVSRIRKRPPRAKLKGLGICSLALAASHPLLDWTNNYGIRPFLPWDATWFYGDLIFIIDPWIWLVLGAAAFLLTRRSIAGTTFWALLGVLLTVLFVVLPSQRGIGVPVAARIIWVVGVVTVVVAYRLKLHERGGRAIAVIALAFIPVYWGAMALLHARAQGNARSFAENHARASGSRLSKVATMPVFANPFVWRSAVVTDKASLLFDTHLLNSDASNIRQYDKPHGRAEESVAEASTDERARTFLRFSRFPVVSVFERPQGGSLVQFVDIRFTEPRPGARGTFVVEVPVAEVRQP